MRRRQKLRVSFLALQDNLDFLLKTFLLLVFDAPEVRIEAVDGQGSGFFVSKNTDLRLRCTIRLPSSVRLSETTRQVVWRYNEEDVVNAGLPQGSFQIERDT